MLTEAAAQKTAQNHDALVVSRTGKPRLAFDIDKPRLPERYGRGNTRGPPEAVATDVEHGQPVDLADACAVEMDHQRADCDEAANFLLDEIQAHHAFFQGPMNV